jgi:hypothetical protein
LPTKLVAVDVVADDEVQREDCSATAGSVRSAAASIDAITIGARICAS